MAGKNTFVRLVLLAVIIALTAPLAAGALAFSPVAASAPDTVQIEEADTPLAPLNTRAQLEAHILAVTVRIEMQTWATFGGHNKTYSTFSHATILDGKYLVTHNHFKYALTEQVVPFGETKGYTGISIRTTQGNLVLDNAPLSTFEIAHEDAQTLVLAFIEENGRGLFENAGLPSAETIDWRTIDLQEGMLLAQVDWDGETAHVDWVPVQRISLDDVERIEVGNFPKKGSSGGGVFWNGYHIGNTWAKNFDEDANSGEVARQYSIIALDSAAVIELAQAGR